MKWTDEELEQQLQAQAEQAGEIWERSLPQASEPPHIFSERFERSMRKLLWRRRHPWLARSRTLAAVLAVCIGIGVGIQFLNSSGSDDTLEQAAGGMAQSSGDASAPSYGNLPPQDSDTDADNRADSGTVGSAGDDIPSDDTIDAPDTPDDNTDPSGGTPSDNTDTPDPSNPSDNTTTSTPSSPAFAAAEPTVLPAGLTVVSRQQSENALTIQYASDSGAAVTYRSWRSAQPQLTGSGETVLVNGAVAAVFYTDATQNTLEWIDARTCYALTGNLSKDELLQMADSTQQK